MSYYHRILFATDLTEKSDKIGDKVLTFAEKSDAELSIVHVATTVPLVYSIGEFSAPTDVELDEQLEKRAKAALMRQAMRLGIPEDRRWFETGGIRSAIIGLAQRLSIDLIVIGSHDRHGLGLLAGSMADTLFHTMPCDVLAIWA